MLKVDLHLHTHFSPDCDTPPQRLVARCLEVGLNCIAVTDHNTIRGALETRRIAPFRVIVGQEVKTSQGEIIGLFLQEEIPPGLDPLETVERIKAQGGLVVLPHPCDPFRASVIQQGALEEVLPLADIIEVFNARNTLEAADRRARQLAEEYGLVMSAVSDAHTLQEVGHTYVEMPPFDGTPQAFKEALAQGRLVTRRTTPLIHVRTLYTKLKRRYWKRP